MRIGIFLLITSMLITATKSYSQDFAVPVDYQLITKEDYSKYENDMRNAAKWLIAVPLNEQQEKRKEVSAFVFKWINGSPTVEVELNPTIMDFEKKNPGMLVIYMAASAKYVLENNYSKDVRAKNRAALRDMVVVYKSGKGIQKDKQMEKLAKSDEDGKIDKWISKNLKIEGL
jgi:hypothetical protein